MRTRSVSPTSQFTAIVVVEVRDVEVVIEVVAVVVDVDSQYETKSAQQSSSSRQLPSQAHVCETSHAALHPMSTHSVSSATVVVARTVVVAGGGVCEAHTAS